MQKKAVYSLYPIKDQSLGELEKDKISKILEIEREELNTFLESENFKSLTIEKIQKNNDHNENIEIFLKAKSIIESINASEEALKKLVELAKKLDIKPEETGYDFNIYEENAIREIEFFKSVRSFSLISAAIGFIPLPIPDYPLLTTMQLGLIFKISNIYEFKIDVKEFFKVVLSTLGAGIVLRTSAKVLRSFIPFVGWLINASVAYAGTYSIGIITKRYIEEGGNLSSEKIKSIWEKSYEDGKKEFNKLKNFILKIKEELLKEISFYKEDYLEKKELILEKDEQKNNEIRKSKKISRKIK